MTQQSIELSARGGCSAQLLLGDCKERMKELPDNSIDSIVTDPPYGLVSIANRFGKPGSAPAKHGKDGSFARLTKGFMGKPWDGSGIEYDVDMWRECLRVLKPGGYMLAFGGTRTYHRVACAIEDAGFTLKDCCMYIFGSGFPKNQNVGAMVDKLRGVERREVGLNAHSSPKADNSMPASSMGISGGSLRDGVKAERIHLPVTEGESEWEGWGNNLKPAYEPIIMAQKPISEKSIAANCLKWGVGAINIDGCRVPYASEADRASATPQGTSTSNMRAGAQPDVGDDGRKAFTPKTGMKGRFPANIILDGSEEVVSMFPQSKGGAYPAKRGPGFFNAFQGQDTPGGARTMGDAGTAARFFYTAKASKQDRDEGLEDFTARTASEQTGRKEESAGLGWNGGAEGNAFCGSGSTRKNHHPTVKPTELMRYLCRLICPPGGVVLDPFAGSGSTGKAAALEGFDFIGIEMDEEYLQIAEARISAAGGEVSIGLTSAAE